MADFYGEYPLRVSGGGGGSGTVTSVGLSLPASVFAVTGSPVTTSGTLTGTFNSQTANTVFAAPNGAAGVPTFRTLVPIDIVMGFTTVATTGTTVMTTASTQNQEHTAASTRTYNLPPANQLQNGAEYYFVNGSSGSTTITNAGGVSVAANRPGGSRTTVTLKDNSTSNGVWVFDQEIPVTSTWGSNLLSVGNAIAVQGSQGGVVALFTASGAGSQTSPIVRVMANGGLTSTFEIADSGQTSVIGATNVIQLLVKGNATQTATIFNVQNSAGSSFFNVEGTGATVATSGIKTPQINDLGGSTAVTTGVGTRLLIAADGLTTAVNFASNTRTLAPLELTFTSYPSTRDDSGTFTPVNFLYTNLTGEVLSAPTSAITPPATTSTNPHTPITLNVLDFIDAVQDTYTNILSRKNAGTLVEGFYMISNPADAARVIIRAEFGSTVSVEGLGLFYNADYQDVGDYSGVVTQTGIAAGTRQGVWQAANEGGYSIGDTVIWNNTHYQWTANALNGTDPTVNTTAYTSLANTASGTGYILEWDEINYVLDTDNIVSRRDQLGNFYNDPGFALFQWGNNVVMGNSVDRGCTLSCINNTNSIANNSIISGGSIIAITNFGAVDSNKVSGAASIDATSNVGNIIVNEVDQLSILDASFNTGDITFNTIKNQSFVNASSNQGDFSQNVVNFSVVDVSTQTSNGTCSSNTLFESSQILGAVNDGSIENNNLSVGCIIDASNLIGDITNNLLETAGSITASNADGSISFNTLTGGGQIVATNNGSSGAITSNIVNQQSIFDLTNNNSSVESNTLNSCSVTVSDNLRLFINNDFKTCTITIINRDSGSIFSANKISAGNYSLPDISFVNERLDMQNNTFDASIDITGVTSVDLTINKAKIEIGSFLGGITIPIADLTGTFNVGEFIDNGTGGTGTIVTALLDAGPTNMRITYFPTPGASPIVSGDNITGPSGSGTNIIQEGVIEIVPNAFYTGAGGFTMGELLNGSVTGFGISVSDTVGTSVLIYPLGGTVFIPTEVITGELSTNNAIVSSYFNAFQIGESIVDTATLSTGDLVSIGVSQLNLTNVTGPFNATDIIIGGTTGVASAVYFGGVFSDAYAGIITFTSANATESLNTITGMNTHNNTHGLFPVKMIPQDGLTLTFVHTAVATAIVDQLVNIGDVDIVAIGRTNVSDYVVYEVDNNAVGCVREVRKSVI